MFDLLIHFVVSSLIKRIVSDIRKIILYQSILTNWTFHLLRLVPYSSTFSYLLNYYQVSGTLIVADQLSVTIGDYEQLSVTMTTIWNQPFSRFIYRYQYVRNANLRLP